MLCWGIPIIVTFLPLINSTYGSPDEQDWCWVVSTSNSPSWAPLFWYWMSFYAWMWMGFIVDVSMIIALIFQFEHLAPSTLNRVRKAFRTCAGYPFILLVCWGGSAVTDFLTYQNPNFELNCFVDTFVAVMDCSLGFLSSIYFWCNEPTLRREWVLLASVHFSLSRYRKLKQQDVNGYMRHSQILVTAQPPCPTGSGRIRHSVVVHVRGSQVSLMNTLMKPLPSGKAYNEVMK